MSMQVPKSRPAAAARRGRREARPPAGPRCGRGARPARAGQRRRAARCPPEGAAQPRRFRRAPAPHGPGGGGGCPGRGLPGPPRPPSAPLPPCTAAPAALRCGRSAAVPPLGARAEPRKQSSPCREWAFNSPAHQGELAGKKKKKIHAAGAAALRASPRLQPAGAVRALAAGCLPVLAGCPQPRPRQPPAPSLRGHPPPVPMPGAQHWPLPRRGSPRRPRGRGSPVGHRGAPWDTGETHGCSGTGSLGASAGHCFCSLGTAV
ncbi:translation initiation factor IF-2-like [Cygnus atratus]|uniref:translation initiation factor IF-2-like n=1 Tax=Cygnus atratus TaxID=8868 RepID=UPI0021B7DE90|nr:translation initiation factor IF-2-like [Cygnus atratus]